VLPFITAQLLLGSGAECLPAASPLLSLPWAASGSFPVFILLSGPLPAHGQCPREDAFILGAALISAIQDRKEAMQTRARLVSTTNWNGAAIAVVRPLPGLTSNGTSSGEFFERWVDMSADVK
jgi:hypothetical protein